jgi:hypothetical protein
MVNIFKVIVLSVSIATAITTMHSPQQQQQQTNLPGPSVTHVPVLYIEESIKSARPEVTGKYDTDWRVYIIYRYGKYLFMGTRQPMNNESNNNSSNKHKNKNRLHRSEKKKNKNVTNSNASWPVISLSFNYPSELYNYISSLFGASKANVTLYVSTAETSACIDDLFTNPSHSSLYQMDEERANRKMELVGYDRVRVPAQYFSESHPNKTNIVKQMLINLDCMCHAPSGMTLSFRCFVVPPASPQPQPQPQTLEPETENINNNNNNNNNNYIYGGDYDNDDYEYDCYD